MNCAYKHIYSKFLLSLLFASFSIAVYGQYVGDDYKKELWKTIKPSGSKPLTLPGAKSATMENKSLVENKYQKSYYNYLYKNLDHLLEITEPEYRLSPNLTTYTGNTPINQLPAGSTQLVFMGGHFYFVSNAGSLVVPSGLDLSGGGKKKLSAKSKSILTNVFGMEVEE